MRINKKQFLKRSSDWLEKISVASLAVGLFQGTEDSYKLLAGFIVGIIAIVGSHILDNREG